MAPMTVLVRRTNSLMVSADRRCRRPAAAEARTQSSASYDGARPCRRSWQVNELMSAITVLVSLTNDNRPVTNSMNCFINIHILTSRNINFFRSHEKKLSQCMPPYRILEILCFVCNKMILNAHEHRCHVRKISLLI